MQNMFLSIVIIVFVLWLERDLFMATVSPLIYASACWVFAVIFLALGVAEILLTILAPIALLLGIESRTWHTAILNKTLSFLKGIGRDD